MRNNLPVVKSPYQGLNYSLGDTRGFNRGELVVITSLDHNYREGLMMDLQLGCLIHNKPTKKSAIVSVVIADTLEPYLDTLRDRHIELGYNDSILAEGKYLSSFHYKVLHIKKPKESTLDDIFKYVLNLEKEGFEVYQINLDDLSKLATTDDYNSSSSIKNIYREVRQFFVKRNTLVFTTIALNDTAAKIRAANPSDYLAEVSAINTYGGVNRLDQIVDCEIFVSMADNRITMYCDKHRGSLKGSHYAIYTLNEKGYLDFDIEGCNKSIIVTRQKSSTGVISLVIADQKMTNVRNRTVDDVRALTDVHASFLDTQVPQELIDLAIIKKAWQYRDIKDTQQLTYRVNEITARWVEPDEDRLVLILPSDGFTLHVCFDKDKPVNYGFPDLHSFPSTDLAKLMCNIQAFDTLSTHDYIRSVIRLTKSIKTDVDIVRHNARCVDLNVSTVELGRIDDDIALTALLESMGREYERYVMRSSISKLNRPAYSGIARHQTDCSLSYFIQMGWLTVLIMVNDAGTLRYDMPVLNLSYISIADLLSDRFDHLLSFGAHDATRFALMTFDSQQSKLQELSTRILNYPKLTNEE